MIAVGAVKAALVSTIMWHTVKEGLKKGQTTANWLSVVNGVVIILTLQKDLADGIDSAKKLAVSVRWAFFVFWTAFTLVLGAVLFIFSSTVLDIGLFTS